MRTRSTVDCGRLMRFGAELRMYDNNKTIDQH